MYINKTEISNFILLKSNFRFKSKNYNCYNSFEGRHTIHKKVPDTITSWIITGFSLDPISGLGLTKESKSLQVFQPFFVSLNLPYSVKRGEVISIPVGVFNYLDDDFDVEVTLHNTDQELEFVQMANEIDAPSKLMPSRIIF